jgi:hypothetical protein
MTTLHQITSKNKYSNGDDIKQYLLKSTTHVYWHSQMKDRDFALIGGVQHLCLAYFAILLFIPGAKCVS